MTGDQTRPADTASPAAIVNALYECISGEAGQERQWTREAGLLHPDARLMRTGIDDDGTPFIKVLNADEYRSNTEPFFAKNAFWEVEIDRRGRRARLELDRNVRLCANRAGQAEPEW